MDALFGLVAPIAALKINVKVDWSSRHFAQSFRSSMCFRVIAFAITLVVIVGNLANHSHMDEVLRPVVLHFLCQNQA